MSFLIAALPIAAVLLMLGVLRRPAWQASLVGLAAGLVVAIRLWQLPVGLAVSSSWAMGYMWFPLMIAWLVKYLILRGSGLRGYRSALPFFLGLIMGEFIIGSMCNIAGLLFGFELYRFWG